MEISKDRYTDSTHLMELVAGVSIYWEMDADHFDYITQLTDCAGRYLVMLKNGFYRSKEDVQSWDAHTLVGKPIRLVDTPGIRLIVEVNGERIEVK